jgi:ATP-dependent protease ClpP protease subunit
MNQEYIPDIKYFPILCEFDDTLLSDFLSFLNNINPLDQIEINLSSPGGAVDVLFSILRIINQNPSKFTIVISGCCDSAALDLILMTDCEKVFLPSFIGGIIHNISMKVNSRELEDAKSDSKARYT